MLANPANLWFIKTNLDAANRYRAKMSPENRRIPFAEPQPHIINSADPSSALNNGVEHRLHVGGRAADDAEHLGGCRLMLQRFAQFRIALLQFLEQPHVLDCDDCLVAKVFNKAICFSVKGRTSFRRITMQPMADPSRSSGVAR